MLNNKAPFARCGKARTARIAGLCCSIALAWLGLYGCERKQPPDAPIEDPIAGVPVPPSDTPAVDEPPPKTPEPTANPDEDKDPQPDAPKSPDTDQSEQDKADDDVNKQDAQIVKVRAKDLESAVRLLGDSEPGTTVVVPKGAYTVAKVLKLTATGEAGKPVTLEAEDGAVHVTGRAGFDIVDSDWLVVDGFTMRHQGRTTNVTKSNNIRLTRMHYRLLQNPALEKKPDVTTHWLRLRHGQGHRVDHSEFGPHPGGLGVIVSVENAVADVRIDHNYFHDRARDGRNGAETVRLGTGGGATIAAVLEDNLFERCDGEIEIVSIKSDGATVRNNTLRDNRGQLVVRNGSDVLISGNYFLGTDASTGSGGVRVHGRNICVAQNYFSGLTTPALSTFSGTFALAEKNGQKESVQKMPKGGYPQASDVVFAGNTVVNANDTPESVNTTIIDVGSTRPSAAKNPLPPRDWTVSNNLLLSKQNLIDQIDRTSFDIRANVVHDIAKLQQDAVPALTKADGIWRTKTQASEDPANIPPVAACTDVAAIKPIELPPPLSSEDMTRKR